MCKFCDNRMNIIDFEDAVDHKFAYCPMCGDALIKCNEYFINLGDEPYWLVDLDEASDPETLAHIIEHTSAESLKDGIPVYRAHAIGVIAGYPKFEQY